MLFGLIFGLLFEGVFWGVIVYVIVKAVKTSKKGGSISSKPHYDNKKSNDVPQCLNEDIHKDKFHTYCDYCGASVERGVKKCPSCGAKLGK